MSTVGYVVWVGAWLIFATTFAAFVIRWVTCSHRYFCCVVGNWKVQNWRLYRLREHRNKTGDVRWLGWDQLRLPGLARRVLRELLFGYGLILVSLVAVAWINHKLH